MADLGVLECLSSEVGRVEDPPPEREDLGSPVLADCGVFDSPKIRHSLRKKSLKPFASRWRSAKSGPKSSLMRMAEMRRGGLRGSALKQGGIKGLERSESRSGKGSKGFGGRARRILSTFPDPLVADSGLEKGLEGEKAAIVTGDVAEMAEDRSEVAPFSQVAQGSSSRWSDAGAVNHLELLPSWHCCDLSLDLIEAQPLMGFVGEQTAAGKDSFMEMLIQEEGERESEPAFGFKLETDEEFPPLSKEGLKIAKGKERIRGGEGGKEAEKGPEQLPKENVDRSKEGVKGGIRFRVMVTNGQGVRTTKPLWQRDPT